jgi:uncharacterized protein (DUF111 family)
VINFEVVDFGNEIINITLEYEDWKRATLKTGVSLKNSYRRGEVLGIQVDLCFDLSHIY